MLASLEKEELDVAEKDKRRSRQRWLLDQLSDAERRLRARSLSA
jgi:hypothetical protein